VQQRIRQLTSTLAVAFCFAVTDDASATAAQASLTPEETARWLAVGQGCRAPLVRIPAQRGAFEIYIESPAARAAVVGATATMMHQALDAAGVRTALQDGYRVWVAYTPSSPTNVTIERITIRPRGGKVLQPAKVRRERLFIGTVASHGIIEPLRARFQEFVFPEVPAGGLEVALHTNTGVERYRVTEQDRARLIRVCNS